MTQQININKLILEIIEEECKDQSPEIKEIIMLALNRELHASKLSATTPQILKDYEKIFKEVKR